MNFLSVALSWIGLCFLSLAFDRQLLDLTASLRKHDDNENFPGPMNREFYQKQSAIYLRNPRSEIHFEPVIAMSKQQNDSTKTLSNEQLPEEQLDLSRVTQDTPAYELAAVIVHSGYTVRSGWFLLLISWHLFPRKIPNLQTMNYVVFVKLDDRICNSIFDFCKPPEGYTYPRELQVTT